MLRFALWQARWLFLAYWVALITNYLPVAGIEILPIGNAADAVLSAAIVLQLYGGTPTTMAGERLRSLAEFAGAAAFAVLGGYAAAQLMGGSTAPVAIVSGVAALGAYRFLFQRLRPATLRTGPVAAPLTGTPFARVLKDDFGLTGAEISVCVLLRQGHEKDEVAARLMISRGTLKRHLSSIYGKTVERNSVKASNRHDKLQRLTVFLASMTDSTPAG